MPSTLDAASKGVLFDNRCDQVKLEILPGPRITQGWGLPYSKTVMVLSKLPEAIYLPHFPHVKMYY